MDDIYKNNEEYSPNKNRKILIVFDDMTADILSNKTLNPIVTEFFIRGRKLSICLIFFVVPKNIRLNSTHYFIMKIPNKRESLSDIDFKDFANLYKICTAKSYSFLFIDVTLASDNPSRFRNSLLEII